MEGGGRSTPVPIHHLAVEGGEGGGGTNQEDRGPGLLGRGLKPPCEIVLWKKSNETLFREKGTLWAHAIGTPLGLVSGSVKEMQRIMLGGSISHCGIFRYELINNDDVMTRSRAQYF